MADTRYLKRRGERWWFQLAVPADVRAAWAEAAPIQKSLQTSDLKVAQHKRWTLVKEYTDRFEALRGRKQWTQEEIEEAARQTFWRELQRMEDFGWSEAALDTVQDEIDEEREETEDGKLGPLRSDLSEREHALITARWAAVAARRKALQDEVMDIPERFGRRPSVNPATLRRATGRPFSKVVEAYLTEKSRDPSNSLTPHTLSKYQTQFRLFREWSNDVPLSSVTRQEAAQFLDEISVLHPNWGKSAANRKAPLAELLVRCRSEVGLSDKSINAYSAALGQVWKWSKRRGDLAGDNPWEGLRRTVRRADTSAYLPFSPEEMEKLLAVRPTIRPNQFRMQEAIPWLTHVGAYTGMRLGEICALSVDNILQEGSVWYFDIVASKSEAGVRVVPIHSKLIEVGLLDYVRFVGSGDLWPLWEGYEGPRTRSGHVSPKFTTHRRALGACRELNSRGRDRLGFHSLRKNVVQCFRRSKVPQADAAEIIGHERLGITYSVYNPDGLTLQERQKLVDMIFY